jgi:inner membrane protein
MAIIAKPPQTPAILAAERSYLGRAYLDWAGYPLVTESSEGDDTVVLFRDLRFGYPQLHRDTILTATVQLDGKLHVVGEAMGPRAQNPPID